MSPFSNKYRFRAVPAWTFLGILLVATPAAGQSYLSLKDAITLGMGNNYSIRIARNDSIIAGREVTYGNAGMLPFVEAYGNWDKASLDAKVHTALGGEIDAKSAPVNLVSAGLQAHWTLFDGTAMFIEYDKLRNLAQLTNLDLRVEVENAVHDITASYFDIVRQGQLIKVYTKKLETSDLRLAVARSKFRSGSGSEREMLQAEVIRLADTTALAQQRTLLKKAEIKLNQLMAVDLRQDYIFEDTITLIDLPPLDLLIKRALEENTAYLQAEKIQNLGTLDLKLLQSKRLPRLTLKGAYSYTENETGASFINYTRTLGPYVGINASVNVFDGMNLSRKINSAKLELDNRGIMLKEMEQILVAQILDAWFEHQNLLQVVTLGQKGISLAKKNMMIASEAFVTGMASSLQLREAQEDLFRADADLIEALFQARVMETTLLQISGELVKHVQSDIK